MTLRKKPFENIMEHKRKCWQPAFSPFPKMFSTRSKTEIMILAKLNLSSENALNLVQSEKLLFGKELVVAYKMAFLLPFSTISEPSSI